MQSCDPFNGQNKQDGEQGCTAVVVPAIQFDSVVDSKLQKGQNFHLQRHLRIN